MTDQNTIQLEMLTIRKEEKMGSHGELMKMKEGGEKKKSHAHTHSHTKMNDR